MKTLITRFLTDKSGVTAIEYGLIASLIAVGIIVTVGLTGDAVDATFQAISDAL